MSTVTARILRPTIALLTLLMEIRYTVSRLIASSLLANFLTRFQALRAEWGMVQQREIALLEQLSDALAAVDIADDHLDDFARRFQQVVLALTGHDKKAGLYTHYFKKSLADLIRPTLSGQLTAMAAWITSLEEPTTPQKLKDMLPELKQLVQAGKDAEKLRNDIKLQIRQFRDIGERKMLIDHINADRKELHSALTSLALSDKTLPSDLAAGYFKVAESGEEEPEETIDSLAIEIKRLEDALLAKRERLVELQNEADKAAQKAARTAEKRAELAALNKGIEEQRQKALELEAEIDSEEE